MLEKLRPYITLVTTNHNYRRLWLSQIISNFGDWFGLLAVYAVLLVVAGVIWNFTVTAEERRYQRELVAEP